ncbi:TonB-dependent receptor [Flavobacteriaceae bacterium]|nr:TonB-dependent receptor [Flavobacteriaceae bacterium]
MRVVVRRICGFVFYGLLFLSIENIRAQNTSQTSTITLEEVSLSASKFDTPRSVLPFSLSVINLKDVQALHQQLSLQEYLGAVPGLFSLNANNYAQDLRISIRGFGARAAFGIRGIKIIVDGIPETTPDGQGQLDNLPLGLLQNIEVLRGPSASLYGNASGGVLSLNTVDRLEGESVRFRSTLGAFGLQSYQLSASLNSSKTTSLFYFNRTQTNGYRTFSGLEQNVFNAKIKHKLSSKSLLQAQLNYTQSPRAEDAGGLTMDEVMADRNQARQRNVDFDTFEKVNQFKVGLRWLQKWRTQWKLDTYAFYSLRDFYGKLPFENGGIIDLYRNYYGLGSRLTYTEENEDLLHRWQIGTETALQRDQRDRFLNQNGTQGANVFSQEERFGSFGLYILDEVQSKKWLLRTSLRFDRQNVGADTVIENQIYTVLNPSVGLSYSLAPQQRIFFNFSTSYETPALSELSVNPSGEEGLNLSLDPSRAINYEAGWKTLGEHTRLEASFFYIKSSNEILPYELEAFPGRSFYRNTGATERYGLELFGEARWDQWKLQASLTQAAYLFAGTDTTSDMEGKRLPGIPNSQAFIQVEYTTSSQWHFQLTGEHIGKFYANDSNAAAVDAYQRVRLQGRKSISFAWGEVAVFGGVHNLFNTFYFDNIRLNAFGGRHYEPAPGRNFFGGLSFGF